jgi:cysteine-rich repeat protein
MFRPTVLGPAVLVVLACCASCAKPRSFAEATNQAAGADKEAGPSDDAGGVRLSDAQAKRDGAAEIGELTVDLPGVGTEDSEGAVDADVEETVVSVGRACRDDDDCSDDNVCNGPERCIKFACSPGEFARDGESCDGAAEASVCRDGNCLPSRCGDGITDERLDEDCDDANGANGDGCNQNCVYSCTSAGDCDDGNVCNGAEECDDESHTCASGADVDGELSCGDGLTCRDGRCVSVGCGNASVDEGEECDDGNTTQGDGCDGECAYECEGDPDCDDGNACNGTETCDIEAHACRSGSDLDCSDKDACTDDQCDPVIGCSPVLIDADDDGQAPSSIEGCGTDCDDTNPQVFSGAGELCDGIDNNCDGNEDEVAPLWYPDCDGDGYATADAEAVQQCELPPNPPGGCAKGQAGTWTFRAPREGTDCWDGDPAAYPRTDAPWSSSASPGRTDLPYDFNCDREQEQRWTTSGVSQRASCSGLVIAEPALTAPLLELAIAPILCSGASGWTGRAVPECGEPAEYTYCDGCTRRVEEYTQQCR